MKSGSLSSMITPGWLDRTAYPFASHYLDTDAGRVHYVDEGDGPPVLMLHGNPTWSFLYRHLIRHLAPRYRCVAPDYLGFGLSDKPAGWSYRPEDHATQVRRLIDTLDLRDLTLVVQDWGGPIGLACALDAPERVQRLVIMNTWMWPVDDDWRFRSFSGFLGGAVGRLLIERFNFFARTVMPSGFADRSRLTETAHCHYLAPLDAPEKRKGVWVFPKAIIASTPWLRGLWARRDVLAERPVLLLWGMRDLAFRERELKRWQALFPHAVSHCLDDVGHYVQEEMGPALGALIENFLQATDA